MTILITGAGLIGCHTARLLADRGQDCLLLDRAPAHEAIASVVRHPRVTVLSGDVTDLAALRAVVERHRVQGIVHTAALLSTAIRQDPVRGVQVNVMGTMHVLELARLLKLRQVVLASSTTVGYNAFGEFQGAAFPEDFPLRSIAHRPGSIYAATKVAMEHLGLLYRDLYATPVIALRYAAVIGAWHGPGTSVPGKVLASLARPAREGRPSIIDDPFLVWRGGEEFIDARDCAHANVAALDALDQSGSSPSLQGVYHIGSGQLHTFEDMVAAVKRLHPDLQVRLDVTPSGGFAGFPHVRHAASDISAAAREIGWIPRYTLNDSVHEFAPYCHD